MKFLRALFAEHAVHHLAVGILHTAHVAAETVLIELFMGVDVPEAAGIRGNLVCEDNLAVGGLAEFDLEVDEVTPMLLKNSSMSSLTFRAIELILSISSCVANPAARIW